MASFSLFTASFAVSAIALTGCGEGGSGPGGQVPGEPVETRPPNARDQEPAFAEQTRAPFLTADVRFEVQTVASGLDHPWGLALLPDRQMLVTERPGRLRVVGEDGELSPAVQGLPDVDARGQGGLLDVALDPGFADNSIIYWSYAEPREGGNGTAVARGRLERDAEPRVEDVEVIWRMTPTIDSSAHFGSRLVFARDGALFITTGERSVSEGRRRAQDLDAAMGKVIRIQPDGEVPGDNPFVDSEGALPEIWSYGHRNMQGAALNPDTGVLWTVEHGARGGDEINVIAPGNNYGWPTITYGVEYSGDPIGDGITQREGMEQPVYYWDPVIAPSGMAFYDGDLFPDWKGSLFVGALAGQHLARLTLDGERVAGEERLVVDRGRIRDVRVGPEGAIYLVTDQSDGEVLKLVPSED